MPTGGEIELRAFAPGLPNGSATASLSNSAEADGVRIELHASEGSVHGVVRDRDGRPVVGARLAATTTDAEGRFALDNLEPGQGKYVVTHPSYAPLAYQFRPTTEPEPVLVLDPGGTIEGAVTDGQGRPVAGVHVATDWPGSSAVSGVGGRFRIEHVPPGEGSIQRQGMGSGGDLERKKAVVETGQTQQVGFRIAGGMLEGSLTKAGEPVSGANISITQPFDGKLAQRPAEYLYQTATSDEEGGWRLAALRPGPATMTVNHGKQSLTFPITVPDSPTGEARPQLPAHILRGVVPIRPGSLMQNACVAWGSWSPRTSRRPRLCREGPDGRRARQLHAHLDRRGRASSSAFTERTMSARSRSAPAGVGCQDVAVDAGSEDDPVTLWFAPKAQRSVGHASAVVLQVGAPAASATGIFLRAA